MKWCVDSLSLASSNFVIGLVWMPDHSGFTGNFKADELDRTGTK